MSVEVMNVQQQTGQICLARCARLFSRAVYRHSEEIGRAAGLRPGRMRMFCSLAALADARVKQPLYTLYRLGQALVEVRGERGRLAFVEWLDFLAGSVGCAVVPVAQRDVRAHLNEQIAQAKQAVARLEIAETRLYLDRDGATGHDVEQIAPLVSEAVSELLEAQQAAEIAAALGASP